MIFFLKEKRFEVEDLHTEMSRYLYVPFGLSQRQMRIMIPLSRSVRKLNSHWRLSFTGCSDSIPKRRWVTLNGCQTGRGKDSCIRIRITLASHHRRSRNLCCLYKSRSTPLSSTCRVTTPILAPSNVTPPTSNFIIITKEL